MSIRWSESFIPTLKEQPKGVDNISHSLSLRAGLVKPLISGVYSYLPLGWKVLLNIITIIREEMNSIGAQEVALPSLSPRDLWERTGRWAGWGDEIFKFNDRKDRELCLAPTHEEIITDIASKELHSYKDLPQIWYQIKTKYRDEPRPRGGVLRVREFMMKDSYSMDVDEEGVKRSYALHRDAYIRIFTRCGLDCKIVEAPSGVMGGGLSEEFMVPSEGGEDRIIVCKKCGYQSNREIASYKRKKSDNASNGSNLLTKIYTPVEGSVDKISEFLKVPPSKLMKSLLFFNNSEPIFVLIRGDHEVSIEKLGIKGLRIAEPHEIKSITGAEAGYVSPIGLAIRTIADYSLQGEKGLVTGANENEYHFKDVDIDRDLKVNEWKDIEIPNTGDICPNCESPLSLEQTIEVGHIFQLGTRYSIPMVAFFLDSKGDQKPIIMGSYGIGIERVMATIIETHYDSNGILWPSEVAPYKVVIIPLNIGNPKIKEAAEEIWENLKEKTEVILDDRDETAGVKFKDAQLIGIPWQIVIGERSISENSVEIKSRDGKISTSVLKANAVSEILKELKVQN
ncbi:MAG: proline--tRNA ligase [Candidatus Stahlbacteria bacterium]|nr:proline--tRNA ligase [Candidatus Stahlbacteria bacterium]